MSYFEPTSPRPSALSSDFRPVVKEINLPDARTISSRRVTELKPSDKPDITLNLRKEAVKLAILKMMPEDIFGETREQYLSNIFKTMDQRLFYSNNIDDTLNVLSKSDDVQPIFASSRHWKCKATYENNCQYLISCLLKGRSLSEVRSIRKQMDNKDDKIYRIIEEESYRERIRGEMETVKCESFHFNVDTFPCFLCDNNTRSAIADMKSGKHSEIMEIITRNSAKHQRVLFMVYAFSRKVQPVKDCEELLNNGHYAGINEQIECFEKKYVEENHSLGAFRRKSSNQLARGQVRSDRAVEPKIYLDCFAWSHYWGKRGLAVDVDTSSSSED